MAAEKSWTPVFNFSCGRFDEISVEVTDSGTVFSFLLLFFFMNGGVWHGWKREAAERL